MKTKKCSSKTPSAEQLEFLAEVEEWKSTISADNLYSLLKDAVNDRGIISADDTHQVDLNQLVQDKVLRELSSLYEEYDFVTAKDASLTDDLRRGGSNVCGHHTHTEDSLVYGEIDLKGFCQLLNDIPHASQDTFYDLGSGSGRAVFAARFVGDYKECIGIELLQNLHELASSVQSLYKFQYRHKLIHQNVKFICADLLNYEAWWAHGTVVYIPNLLFDETLMDKIAEKANHAPPGACWICLKKFSNMTSFYSIFELIQQRSVPMSWGESNVYVYRRRNSNDTEAASS